MTIILFIIFLAISLGMVIWGLRRPDRYFQFPTLAGSVWLLYIVPQAFAVVINPVWIPLGALQDGGVEMALLMASLCAGLSFLGYLLPARSYYYIDKHVNHYIYQRLFFSGCFLIVIAYFSLYKLAGLSGGLLEYYSIEGSYQLTWAGLPVVYIFFVKLVYPGLALCLLVTLKKPTWFRIFVIVAGSFVPLANVFILGRRTHAVTLLLTFGICFFFQKNWTPKRSWVISAIILGGLMVIVLPAYRVHSQIGADYRKILEIDIKDIVLAQMLGEEPTEFIYPVVQLAATQRIGEFNYGLGFYNEIVQQLVPTALVGKEMKDNLFIRITDFSQHTNRYYLWRMRTGWIPTGVTDAFREFWFLGSLLFLLVGRLFLFLWNRAYYKNDIFNKLIYIALAPTAMLSVISGVTSIPVYFIYMFFFLLPIYFYVRKPNSKKPI